MKNTFKIVVLMIALSFTTNLKAQCGNDQALIGQAIAAAHDCLHNVKHRRIRAYVETTSICFYTGSLRRVTLYTTPYCPPGFYCPQYVILLATVEFGCDGQVTSVTCGEP